MKKMTRILAIVLAVAMMATLFVGCSPKAPASTDATNSSGQTNATNSTEKGEPTLLRVEMFDRGQSFSNGDTAVSNEATRWLQKEFGDPNNIKLEFVAVPRQDEVAKINLFMAGKSAPDVMFTYDRDLYFEYAKKGGLMDLTDMIDDYPNLKKYATMREASKYMGKEFGIIQPPTNEFSANQCEFMMNIRKDWLDKLGLKVPTTQDEFYNVLKAFRDADPKLLGVKRVIPWTMAAVSFSDEDWQQNTKTCTDSFKKKMTDEEFATLPELLVPGFKDGVQFLNKCYNEGLIDPDFALQNDFKTVWKQVANGEAGVWCQNTEENMRRNQPVQTLVDTIDGVEVVPIHPFPNYEGKHLNTGKPTAGLHVFIPVFSKNAEAAMKYLDFITTPENGIFLRHGKEGVHWKREDGLVVAGEQNGCKKVEWATEFYPVVQLAPGTEEEIIKSNNRYNSPKMAKLKNETLKMKYNDVYWRFEFDRPLDMKAKYVGTLDNKFQDTMIKSITCKPEEFSDLYDQMTKQYMEMGGQEVLNEKIEAYHDMMKNKK